MVGIGTALALLGVLFGYVRIRKRRLPESRWFYWAVVAAGPASVVALIAGWVTTEVGRQPWVVFQRDAHRRGGDGRRRGPGRLRDAGRGLRGARRRGLVGAAPPGRTPLASSRQPSRRRGSGAVSVTLTLPARPDLAGLDGLRRARRRRLRRGLLVAAGRARRPTRRRCATTPTTRWARCGRRTTSG